MIYKRYVILAFIATFIFLMIITKVNATVDLPLLGKVIIIDPGHGGRDPGTIYGNIYEKDINLSISKVLERVLSMQ